MRDLLRQLADGESGQDLIEYALLAGFVSLVVVQTTTNIGVAVNEIFDGVGTQVGAIPGP